jgi:hypothetical protein
MTRLRGVHLISPPWRDKIAGMLRLPSMALWFGVSCLLLAGTAPAAVRSYVVVVGNNSSVQPGVKPLSYADDDAARYYELFAPFAARIALLTVMDADTQRVHGDLPAKARPPTRANLFATLDAFNIAMAADKRSGDEPVLYFIYIGHGHVGQSGQAYVSLLDGAFTGDELVSHVVARSEAVFNHLILDACNSYLLVASRGSNDEAGPDGRDAIRHYVDERTLDRYPNTGMVLSTSGSKESHEWSVFRGGVFSQLVRSGLLGIADANSDGRVEYSELGAFLAAASSAVDDPRARIEAFVQPPRVDRNRPLIDLAETHYRHFLRLPPSFTGRFYIEDPRGVRYLDGNKTTEAEDFVALVEQPYYFVRRGDLETRIDLADMGTIDLGALEFGPLSQASRGSLAEEFRTHLLQVPYGPGFYRGFVASTSAVPARHASRPFPPVGMEPRAKDQPFKDPYDQAP